MAGKKTLTERHDQAMAEADGWLDEVDEALQENDEVLHGEEGQACSQPQSSTQPIRSHG